MTAVVIVSVNEADFAVKVNDLSFVVDAWSPAVYWWSLPFSNLALFFDELVLEVASLKELGDLFEGHGVESFSESFSFDFVFDLFVKKSLEFG